MSTKTDKIDAFDPNGASTDGSGIFGLPFTIEESNIVIIPATWDVTVSYGEGTSRGPQAILDASKQVDLYDPDFPNLWKGGISMEEISQDAYTTNDALRLEAKQVIDLLEAGENIGNNQKAQNSISKINSASEDFANRIKNKTIEYTGKNKMTALLGGDHSCSLGHIQAMATAHEHFGILQIDAHADLRNAYEGFTYSHASIMHNVLSISEVQQIVQVGIRDFCEEEALAMNAHGKRIRTYTDKELRNLKFKGTNWDKVCQEICSDLPANVYITLDIDGLDPSLCPNTGTPVPGGLTYDELIYFLESLFINKKKIIGFDLVEVAPGKDEWDANVGARILYKLCGWMAKSQNRI